MKARLTLVAGEAKPEWIDLNTESSVTIGRSRENTIVLPKDEHASRQHAEIYYEHAQWFIRDKSLNGTKVDGDKIDQIAKLDHGTEIRIGDVKLQFSLQEGAAMRKVPPKEPVPVVVPVKNDTPPSTTESSNSAVSVNTTRLHLDELSTLCHFNAIAMEVQDPNELIRQGLRIILQQTSANFVGYLSLDRNDPLPKLVMPESAAVDVPLSQQLSRRVERDNKAVWLSGDSAFTRPSNTDNSLYPFQDAICIPLKAAGNPALGAIHVYRTNLDFTERDVRFCELLSGTLAGTLQVLKEKRKLAAENNWLRSHLPINEELLGDSKSMMAVRDLIRRAAPQPYTVLITGESGVGKELVAMDLYRKSNRASGPFVAVNCAAIPSTLIEAELFGYRKNTFTGADRDHPGYFQQADDGVLFLDEIGELSMECQAKLLRVLESKTFRPLGATSDVKADFRVIAATNRNLETEIKAGKFRSDLYYRLNRIPIAVPPLREHLEDIPTLVSAFMERLCRDCKRNFVITSTAVLELQKFSWPGNVRQLLGILESLSVLADGEKFDADLVRRVLSRGDQPPMDIPPSMNQEDVERWNVERALKKTNGNVSQASTILGISRDTLHSRLKKWNIQRSDAAS